MDVGVKLSCTDWQLCPLFQTCLLFF